MRIKEIPKDDTLQQMAGQHPELNVASVQAMLWIFRFSGELEKALEIHLARWGISRGRFLVLAALYNEKDRKMSPSALADKIDVTRGNMTGLIDTLEKDGYVDRQSSEKDRRCHAVLLSKKGHRFLEKLLPDHFKRIAMVFQEVSSKDQKRLIGLLQKLEGRLNHIRLP